MGCACMRSKGDVYNALADLTYSKKIYFDGFLPPEKRTTRLSRLDKSLRKLITTRAKHGDFNSTKTKQQSHRIDVEQLFDSSKPLPDRAGGILDAPFLVPAILDILSTSEFSSRTEVVPGEADSFCASAARKEHGTILTNDSDLLLYDLDLYGAVASFSSLDLQPAENNCKTVSAQFFKPKDMAKSLGLENLLRMAFELREDHTITLNKAVQRAKQDIEAPSRLDAFRNFCKVYSLDTELSSAMIPTKLSDVRTAFESAFHDIPSFLDPRVSELVLQGLTGEQASVQIYLPFLIDDPSRSSAWAVSRDLRRYAYHLLLRNSRKTVLEYSRRGVKIQQTVIDIEDSFPCASKANLLCQRLSLLAERFYPTPPWVFWRVFAMMEVFQWYRDGRTVPSTDMASKAFEGRDEIQLSWQDIHLSAQIEAALYSIRILKQIVGHVIQQDRDNAVEELLDLNQRLATMPPLSSMIPARPRSTLSFMKEVTTDQVLELILDLERKEHNQDEEAVGRETTEGSSESSHTSAAWTNVMSTKKKRRSKNNFEAGKKTSHDLVLRAVNPYSVLA